MKEKCERCGEPLPGDVTGVLCRSCLLGTGLETEAGTVVEREVETEAQAATGPPAESGLDTDAMLHGRFSPGTKINERYRIVSLLGKGAMGEVYRVDDLKLKQAAALKMLPEELASNRKLLDSLLNEARRARQVTHPNVCRVHDIDDVGGVHFLTMEFIEGEDLGSLIRRIGRLPRDKALELGRQLCEGVQAGHKQGVLHLDLKPGNLMIDEKGELKIADFGLARLAVEAAEENRVAGTPAYMAPEQMLRGEGSERSDIYAIGLILFEMLTGRRGTPVKGVDKIRKFHSDGGAIEIPVEFDSLLADCVSADPARRPGGVATLLERLSKVSVEEIPAGDSTGSHSRRASMEVLVPEKVGECDVLLNYAAIDDQPLLDGKPGWVSELHRNLKVRVEQLSGEKVNIARLPEESVTPLIETELQEHLPELKAMISVVSPPFVHSDVCLREVERFWKSAGESGNRWVEDKARLLKVLKTAVAPDEIPSRLADIFSPLLGFEFFEKDPETGRIREFDETFGPALKQRFFERVYDLAYDVSQILRLFKQIGPRTARNGGGDGTRHRVYLATTTSDAQDERDRIRRELLERGHQVLPDGPLPMLSSDIERAVQECLAECTIAVHLLGRHYGTTPEDSAESMPAVQVRMTAQEARRKELKRLIWMPGIGGCVDERQQQFLNRVQEDASLQFGAEIIEGDLNLLKKDLIRCLAPPEEKNAESAAGAGSSSDGTPKVYLVCDPKDEEAVEALEDYLFDQGLEVCLPAFDGDDADAAALHQENLLSCDAVLVYYGAAPKAWVDIKLRELLKAAGYGRETPIGVQGVYIAPPDDRRKGRFRSHQASVIHQPADFAPCAELDAFVGQIKEVCA